MSSMADKIMKRVAAHHRRQWVYSPKALLNLGSRETVDQALLRLVKSGAPAPGWPRPLRHAQVQQGAEAYSAGRPGGGHCGAGPAGRYPDHAGWLGGCQSAGSHERGTRQGQLCDRRPHGAVPTCRAKRHAVGGEAGGSGGSGAEVAWPQCRVDSRVLSTLNRQLPEHVKRDLMQNEHNLPGWALPLAHSITNGQRSSYEWRFRVAA